MKIFIKNINFSVYFILMSLFSMYLAASFLENIPTPNLRDQFHAFLILFTYGVIYQLPSAIWFFVFKKWKIIAVSVAVLLSALSHILIFADSNLYDLYGFHINGFVWNLVTTKGGIESVGADQTNYYLVALYVGILITVHVLGLILSATLNNIIIWKKTLIALFILATLSERLIFGYSRAELYAPVMDRADAFPLYKETKMNKFLVKIGLDVKKSKKLAISANQSKLSYPKKPINYSSEAKPKNIIMLVSESLRWDMMTPDIMPSLYKLSEKSWNLTHHYSGGNGTRQGMFSLFYGLYGNYWDAFLREKRGPVLIDALNKYNYQYFIYTSASFTYPEFKKTIFAQIPDKYLLEDHKGEPWKRDTRNTTHLINRITNRDKNRPFYGFMFFEETHARYSFDPKHEINHNYLKSLNYFGLSRKELAPQIDSLKSRYIDAAHGIDIQIERIISALKENGDIDNTIIIVTGDHGEEFMERSRWGHNSDFTDWQIRVPMIISIPGKAAKKFVKPTSHIDITPTLLSELGVTNKIRDYSLGVDLSKPINERSIIVASWTDIGIINQHGKLVIPFKTTTQHKNLALTTDDRPMNPEILIHKMGATIASVLSDIRHYYH